MGDATVRRSLMRNSKCYLYSALSLLMYLLVSGCTIIRPVAPDLSQVPAVVDGKRFSYDAYERVLDTFVTGNGLVHYSKLRSDRISLDLFYAMIAAISPDSHPHLFPSKNDRLAYWINAYNSTVLLGVVEQYPLSSVTDVKAPAVLFFFPDQSGFFFFQRFVYGGSETSLYFLENTVIRQRFDDPRFHFALNCASRSCPKLPRLPFYPAMLDSQLDAEARKFINSTENVRYDHSTETLYLSAIFDWYEDDFLDWLREKHHNGQPSLLAYLLLYAEGELKTSLTEHTVTKIRFLEYDWGLNDAKK